MLSKATNFFTTSWKVTKAGFISFIRKQNDRTWNGILHTHKKKRERERERERKKPKTVPSALKTIHTVLGCWRTHESRVVPQWKIFRRSRNFVVSRTTNVLGGRKLSCYTTVHGPTLFVCAWTGFGWNAETIHPTGLTWPFYCTMFGFVKDQMRGQVLCKTNSWNGVLLQRGFSDKRSGGKYSSIGIRDFVENKCSAQN